MIVEKFGLRGKHIAARGRARERPRRCAAARARCSTRRASTRRRSTPSCTSARCGRTTPCGRRRRGSRTGSGATNAFALEYDNVSHGSPDRAARRARPAARRGGAAQRAARRRLPRVVPARLRRTSARASCSTSATARSRRSSIGDARRNELLGAHAITDGSFSLQVKVPRGGSRRPERRLPLPRRRRPGVDEGAASTTSRCRTSSPPRAARSSGRARRSPTSASSARCT